MLVQLKKKLLLPVVAIFAAIFFFSCQKDIDNTVLTPNNDTPDLTTKVNSSVSGFVSNENNEAVLGASVQVGTRTTSTDKYGYFEIKNVDVVKTAAVVTVAKAGYFKGIKTYLATADKSAFFRIKLIPKTTAGTISASAGGNVTLTNGMIIALPADAVVNAATNAAYTGSVNVAVSWINPEASDLNQIMPGDLRGIDDGGFIKGLTTYGMAAVELTGASGELLQIAAGKKSTITMPMSSLISSTAPATIPLWYFNEGNGLWKQEGTATKSGNTYVGDVSHFSFWNCDVPANYVQVNCTIVNASGAPLAFTSVKISVVGSTSSAWGYTDSSGYVAGAIPANAQLLLEVFSYYGCGAALYSQNFSSTSVNLSLGTIMVNNSSTSAQVSGTVTNCIGNPVTNGYIIINNNNFFYRYPISNTGSFSFTNVLCNASTSVLLIAEDNVGLQQSVPASYTLVAGPNMIGNLVACGVNTQEFINYTVNGGAATVLTSPGDSLYHSGNGTNSFSYISGSNAQNSYINFSYDNTNIGIGSTQNLSGFYTSAINDQVTVSAPFLVNITEYGAVGQFIAGNFTGIVIGSAPANTSYTVTCTFRVRRNF